MKEFHDWLVAIMGYTAALVSPQTGISGVMLIWYTGMLVTISNQVAGNSKQMHFSSTSTGKDLQMHFWTIPVALVLNTSGAAHAH